jgi:predicted MFS family arabinose efflux permease
MAPKPEERTPMSGRVIGFLAAEAVSAIGSWATIVAVWGYAAYKYDATAGDISLFGIAFSLPGVIIGPIAGTIIDRVGPKTVLFGAKALGVIAALMLLTARDFHTLSLLCAVHGVASAFSEPALQALPPRVVDERHLARTNAMVSLTDEFAIVFGPLAAGITIAVFGFHGAFVFDALTYALGLVVLPIVRLKPLEPVRGAHNDAGEVDEAGEVSGPVRFRDALEGWKLVLRSGALRRVVACTAAVHLLYGAALLAEPLYVRDTLHQSEKTFAALQTVFGICLVLGGLLAARLGERLASFGFVALGVGLSGGTAVIYLGTPFTVVAFCGVAVWGVATALISGPSRTLLQRASPQRAHGRVLSADFVAANTTSLLGVSLAGFAVGWFGVPWTILVLGAGVSATAAALWRSDRRELLGSGAPVELASGVGGG